MKKSLIISLMVAALVCAFALPSVIAGNAAPDNIVMKAPGDQKMTKAPVDFPHKKHVDGKIDCMTCHHKATDKNAIKSCSTDGCHVDASKGAKKDPKGFYQAFHNKTNKASCMGCHKAENKGPKGCKDCHPKK